jgi:hypothetical protein
VVHQAPLDALKDDFGADAAEDDDSAQVVLSGWDGATAKMGFLDAGPTLVDGLSCYSISPFRIVASCWSLSRPEATLLA